MKDSFVRRIDVPYSVTNTGLSATTASLAGTSSVSTFGTPVLSFDVTSSPGVVDSAIRVDATIALFSASPPTSVSLVPTGTGIGGLAARYDHIHQLDQTINPVWTGLHVYADSTSPQISMGVHGAAVNGGWMRWTAFRSANADFAMGRGGSYFTGGPDGAQTFDDVWGMGWNFNNGNGQQDNTKHQFAETWENSYWNGSYLTAERNFSFTNSVAHSSYVVRPSEWAMDVDHSVSTSTAVHSWQFRIGNAGNSWFRIGNPNIKDDMFSYSPAGALTLLYDSGGHGFAIEPRTVSSRTQIHFGIAPSGSNPYFLFDWGISIGQTSPDTNYSFWANGAGNFANGLGVGVASGALGYSGLRSVVNGSTQQVRVEWSPTSYTDIGTDAFGNLFMSPTGAVWTFDAGNGNNPQLRIHSNTTDDYWIYTASNNMYFGHRTGTASQFIFGDINSAGKFSINADTGAINVGQTIYTIGNTNLDLTPTTNIVNLTNGVYLQWNGDTQLVRKAANVLAMGVGDAIQSSTFTSGFQGWSINDVGNAEFNNVSIRGEMRASVFTVAEIHALGGTQFLSKSAGTLFDAATTQ